MANKKNVKIPEAGQWPDKLLVPALIAGLVLWAHRGNIVRLLQGKESKFRWHGKEEKA